MDVSGNIVTEDERKAEVLNAFFAFVFNSQNSCAPGAQLLEPEGRDWEQNETPIIQGETVNDLLHHLDTYKSMGPHGMHPRVLEELVEGITKPLFLIYQQSCLTGEVPVDWKLANVMPFYKKGQKEDVGNYRPVSPTLVPEKIMEQMNLSNITQHIQENHIYDQVQSPWVYERQVLFDQPDLLLLQGDPPST